jgi:hypothetical protein
LTVRQQLNQTIGTLHQIAFDLDQHSVHTLNPSTRLLYTQCLHDVEQVIHHLEYRQDYLSAVESTPLDYKE